MPDHDTDDLAPIHRLLAIAERDGWQAKLVAKFLLAWSDARSCGGFDLTDLWQVDRTVTANRVTAIPRIAAQRAYLATYGLAPRFERLAQRRGQTRAGASA